MLLMFFVTICVSAGVLCMPLSDQGPHIAHGWGQVVRLRHLYAATPGLHLLISEDGHIHGAMEQTRTAGLLEIRPVETGLVVIRGAATTRFLCMESDGRLYSSHIYNKADCTFREQILADGYNVYTSDHHGVPLSLGTNQQRLQGVDRGVPALARFLPRINTLPQTIFVPDVPDQPGTAQTEESVDVMDSFGKLSQIIHSPSFQKR
ncbi:fibroblast growth factor 19 isoform X3 [Nematolebias whitei]|uniref:fibroblast growth factor 19 isoform X3 n=1 Tax=Nematolebias whitei TaxID=451745 RepID=UPI00189B543E|nr:fibroblast growth factor 19 isoform X3 [Nematolebias whitei]